MGQEGQDYRALAGEGSDNPASLIPARCAPARDVRSGTSMWGGSDVAAVHGPIAATTSFSGRVFREVAMRGLDGPGQREFTPVRLPARMTTRQAGDAATNARAAWR